MMHVSACIQRIYCNDIPSPQVTAATAHSDNCRAGLARSRVVCTLVIVSRQLTMHGLFSKLSRLGPAWAAVPALLGAIAALTMPGTTSPATAEAAMLAVGALA